MSPFMVRHGLLKSYKGKFSKPCLTVLKLLWVKCNCHKLYDWWKYYNSYLLILTCLGGQQNNQTKHRGDYIYIYIYGSLSWCVKLKGSGKNSWTHLDAWLWLWNQSPWEELDMLWLWSCPCWEELGRSGPPIMGGNKTAGTLGFTPVNQRVTSLCLHVGLWVSLLSEWCLVIGLLFLSLIVHSRHHVKA